MLRPPLALAIVLLVILWLAWQVYGKRWRRNVAARRCPSIVTVTCIGKKGQLGNQLFQAAAAIGVAHANDCEPVLPADVRGTKLARLVHLEGVRLGEVVPTKTLKEERPGFFSRAVIEPRGEVYGLDGYFQSHLYLAGALHKLRRAFRVREEILRSAREKAPGCTQRDAIAVHVRRGDYLSAVHAGDFNCCAAQYYRRGVAAIRAWAGQASPVLVCSDDLPWCRENLAIPGASFVETGSDLEDFAVLLLCQHSVIANSSFSWWAAFLKERGTRHLVVAPSPWYKHSGRMAGLNSDEIYLPEWIVLDAEHGTPYTPRRIGELASLAQTRFDHDPSSTVIERHELYGPCYVVSMDSARERWESARRLLAGIGIEARRFPAIDRRTLSSLGGRLGLEHGGLLAPYAKLEDLPTIGCGLSHMSLWAHALVQGVERVTIFEDDITSTVTEAELSRRVREALSAMGEGWDILFLGKCIDRCQLFSRVHEGLYRTRRPMCMHAYMISAAGMRKILARPLETAVDAQIVEGIESGVLRAFTFHPSVFVQDVVRWSSSLRSYKHQVSNQNDCEYLS